LVIVILVSCVYTNENSNENNNNNNNKNNNDIEELMYSDNKTDDSDSELRKFFEKENHKLSHSNTKPSKSAHITMLQTSFEKKKSKKNKV